MSTKGKRSLSTNLFVLKEKGFKRYNFEINRNNCNEVGTE